MFDYVNYEAPCPACGGKIGVGQWQSKDGDCAMTTVPVSQVNYFYAICPKCEAWVDALVQKAVIGVELTAKKREEWYGPIKLGKEGPNEQSMANSEDPNGGEEEVGE